MKSLIILALVIVFMFVGWLVNGWIQRIIKPRQSFSRLLLYFFSVMILVFVLSFLMVFIIGKLYPGEVMK